MKDPVDVQPRFVVGSAGELEGLKGRVEKVGGRIDESRKIDNAYLVLARTPTRYAEDIASALGPNAQVLEEEGEARVVLDAAAAGEPHEA